jgi:tetratricopeptide (TPR) repeat protein
LKLADCEFRLGRNENAARSYELARRLSIDNHISRLEALSAASEAVFKSRVGETVEALQLYQRALRLDDQLKDRGNEAIDWYNYGLFLREKGYPDRLAYAAMLKSQSLLTETSDAERLAAVAVELKSLERRSAAKLLAVPKDLDATVAESLNVR